MTDWTSGYVADIGYTYGYYTELNPLRVRLAFLNAGLVAPEVGTACELGFGQGLSANIHAAATITKWFGTDFNPSQAGFAQELAKVSGSDAQLFDEAFLDFSSRSDLPDFDYIGLHGIWSWISEENRTLIVEFIRRKLRVGGVLYVSYNTLPGWAAFAPMRHLMTEHAEIIGAEGRGIITRINDAIDFAEKLLTSNPLFSRANPLVGERIKKLKEQNRHYLAHEYFNRDWHPMHFSTMAQWLGPSKVQYACSANYLDHIDIINITNEQATFLKEIPDPMFRQSVRDFIVNQQFRKDYWVKGARTLSPVEQSERIRSERLLLASQRGGIDLKISGALGEATLSESVYAPILDLMADYRVREIREIEREISDKGINFAQLVQAVIVLSGAGHLVSVQSDEIIRKARKHTEALNKFLKSRARGSGDVAFLASPVTGGGITVSRFQQLFLSALDSGKKHETEVGAHAWEVLASQGQRLIKDGKTLETAEENRDELSLQAKDFIENSLPVFRALHIAET
jgi:SAM-dependent methyltransferase